MIEKLTCKLEVTMPEARCSLPEGAELRFRGSLTAATFGFCRNPYIDFQIPTPSNLRISLCEMRPVHLLSTV